MLQSIVDLLVDILIISISHIWISKLKNLSQGF